MGEVLATSVTSVILFIYFKIGIISKSSYLFGCAGPLLLYMGLLSSCSEPGLLSNAACRLLIVVAPLLRSMGSGVPGFQQLRTWVWQLWLRALERRLSSCGAAPVALCTWDLPEQGLNPHLPP